MISKIGLVFGPNGQLGKEFIKNGSVPSNVNITDFDAVGEELKYHLPDVVFNCAAYTNVDGAETEVEKAFLGNAVGPRILATHCNRLGIKLVHFSSDMTFYDSIYSTYKFREYNRPNPVSVYGKSKLEGDRYVQRLCPNHLILKTSWLYGDGDNNFVAKLLKNNNDEIILPADMYGYPTSCKELVKQTLSMLDRCGLYHAVCYDENPATYYSWAQEILPNKVFLKKYNSYHQSQMQSITYCSNNYFNQHKYSDNIRSSNCCLENFLLNIEGINIMKPWKEALNDFLGRTK